MTMTIRLRIVARLRLWGAALAVLALAGGSCAFPEPTQPAAQQPQQSAPSASERVRARPPVNTTRNLYEGSLWQGASSWGNLLRDHRARYQGDLLTVNTLSDIISVPEPKPEPPPDQQQQGQGQGQGEQPTDPVLRFLREQEQRRREIEREQYDILRSIDTIEVQVVDVLQNGNMKVRGVHPPIFRDRNRVKYIVTLEGLVRPADVDDNNTVPAAKLSRAEYRIRRFVKRQTPPLGSVARAAGNEQGGALLDRFTDFLTSPGTGNRNTQVSPR